MTEFDPITWPYHYEITILSQAAMRFAPSAIYMVNTRSVVLIWLTVRRENSLDDIEIRDAPGRVVSVESTKDQLGFEQKLVADPRFHALICSNVRLNIPLYTAPPSIQRMTSFSGYIFPFLAKARQSAIRSSFIQPAFSCFDFLQQIIQR